MIRTSHDPQLAFLMDIANLDEEMKRVGVKSKIVQLIWYTAIMMACTCQARVDSRSLFKSETKFCIIMLFTTDFIEKCIRNFRQGSDGIEFYFCTERVRKNSYLAYQLGLIITTLFEWILWCR